MDDLRNDTPLRVALLGCGVVGSQVARLLLEQSDDLASRIGRRLELVGIAVRDATRVRPGLPPELFTTDAEALVTRDDIDIVIEVIGGIEPTRTWLLQAMEHGASVVTANKALLAQESEILFSTAAKKAVDLYFEAAVAGAIPIVRPLQESLVGDEIHTVMGIVNGTTNYILDKMHADGANFAEALAEAQERGFAEADPTADIEGHDAAAKAALIASMAFHTRVRGEEVFCEGITDVTAADVEAAKKLGCVVKLLAVAALTDTKPPQVSVRVHPAMMPGDHPLAAVTGAYNAIFVEAESAGRLMFLGPGAGGEPTAAAITGDLVTVARNRVRGAIGPGESTYTRRRVVPITEARTRYYLRFVVKDEPGVLAGVASIFARHGVSVQSVHQNAVIGPMDGWAAELGMVTHHAQEGQLRSCLAELRDSEYTQAGVRVLRVEGMAS